MSLHPSGRAISRAASSLLHRSLSAAVHIVQCSNFDGTGNLPVQHPLFIDRKLRHRFFQGHTQGAEEPESGPEYQDYWSNRGASASFARWPIPLQPLQWLSKGGVWGGNPGLSVPFLTPRGMETGNCHGAGALPGLLWSSHLSNVRAFQAHPESGWNHGFLP